MSANNCNLVTFENKYNKASAEESVQTFMWCWVISAACYSSLDVSGWESNKKHLNESKSFIAAKNVCDFTPVTCRCWTRPWPKDTWILTQDKLTSSSLMASRTCIVSSVMDWTGPPRTITAARTSIRHREPQVEGIVELQSKLLKSEQSLCRCWADNLLMLICWPVALFMQLSIPCVCVCVCVRFYCGLWAFSRSTRNDCIDNSFPLKLAVLLLNTHTQETPWSCFHSFPSPEWFSRRQETTWLCFHSLCRRLPGQSGWSGSG